MKKFIAIILCMSLVTAVCFSGCSNKDEKPDKEKVESEEDEDKDEEEEEEAEEDSDEAPLGDTKGAAMYAEFLKIVADEKDVNKIAEELATEKVTGYECITAEVEPGLLNGFTDSVDGFNDGAVFGPVIGTIPLIGYVFETDDPEALKSDLLSLSDMRWNICTEADETFCEVYENYVFFVMCPNE